MMLEKIRKPREKTQYNKFIGHCIWDTMQKSGHTLSAPEAMSACAYAWQKKGTPGKNMDKLINEYLKGEKDVSYLTKKELEKASQSIDKDWVKKIKRDAETY